MPSADLLSSVVERRGRWRSLTAGLAAVVVSAAAICLSIPGLASRTWTRFGFFEQASTVVPQSRADDATEAIPVGRPELPERSGTAVAAVRGASSESLDDAPSLAAPRADASDLATRLDATPPRAPELRARPLSACLAEIAEQASRGLVLAPDVGGDALAMFEAATPWRDRLAALARVHGFQYAVSERLIEVWTKTREDPGAKGQGLAAEEAPAVTIVDRPVHARADDLVTAVAKAARATKVQVSADPGSNAVVIAGTEPAASVISDLVRTLDVPRRRFVLEAEIVELSRKARQELGVRWSIDGTIGAIVNFPPSDVEGEGASVIVATDGAHALRARISALAADGHVRVVSRPRVVVLEGRPASIESVRILRVRFPEQTAIVGEATDAQGVSGGRAVEEIPIGVTLRVEPSMQGDGRIVLRIRAKSSTLGPPQPPDNIPEELSRMVDAEVAVADGETAVLGGLMREGYHRSGSGVPVLRSVPLLGVLFGKREHEDDEEELVVLVTPRLLPP